MSDSNTAPMCQDEPVDLKTFRGSVGLVG